MRSLKGQPSVITTVTDEAPALPFLISASAIPNATEVSVEDFGQDNPFTLLTSPEMS